MAVRSQSARFKVAVTLFATAAGLLIILVAELYLARRASQLIYSRLESESPPIFERSGVTHVTLLPNARARVETQEYDVAISINGQGLRMDREVNGSKAPEGRRVLVLGDSFPFGWGVKADEAFPSILERRAVSRGLPVEVINFGMTKGLGPDTYYAAFREPVPIEADVVVVSFSIANDLTDRPLTKWPELDATGLPKRVAYEYLRVDDAHRLRVHDTQFRYRVPILRESHLFIRLAKLAGDLFSASDDKGHMLPSEVISTPLLYMEEWPPWLYQALRDKVRCLVGLRDVTRSRGQVFLVALIPQLWQVYRIPDEPAEGEATEALRPRPEPLNEVPQRRLFRALAVEGVEVLDLLPGLVAAQEADLFYRDDQHLTPRGHAVVGEIIAADLEHRGWLAPR